MAAVRDAGSASAGSSWRSARSTDRLADIDHPPVPVAEQVHAGMVGNGLRLRPWAGRDGHRAILGRSGNTSVAAGSSLARLDKRAANA